MIVCCTANRPSRSTFVVIAPAIEAAGIPLSIDLGTTQLPTNPMRYRNVPKKNTYVVTPYMSVSARATTLDDDQEAACAFIIR
jgi:hypothetical protein